MIKPFITAQKCNPHAHGGGVRGDNSVAGSSLSEGRFGRMFRSLPATDWKIEALRELGNKMSAPPETFDDDPTLPKATAETEDDDEENTGISAGYTYFGQFIDHDITFDPASSLQQKNDPDALVDFRTPALDLDSLYGRGPADQPYLYTQDSLRFRLGRPLTENGTETRVRDLPRFFDKYNSGEPARALIGDKRNDENVIIAQLHAAFLQFHNKVVDDCKSFSEAQRRVRWHYQWLVVNDFLPKICGDDVVNEIIPHRLLSRPIWENRPCFQFYRYREDPYIPIEFSAAAYRFGHSMVRPIYRLNTKLTGDADEMKQGIAGRQFIFAGVQERGLNGFNEFPDIWAIDWSLFFDIDGSGKRSGKERVQPAYKIDSSLVNPLAFLPEFSNPVVPLKPPLNIQQLQCVPAYGEENPANLAIRNLLRGVALRLPSGQAVARAMGVTVLANHELRVGKAVVNDYANSPTLKSICPRNFSDSAEAPLWFYILAEAQHEWFQRANQPGSAGDKEPVRLGKVGGRIVAETLLGLLWHDSTSYLRQAPNWNPEFKGMEIRTIGQLLKIALN